jgi:uncharacterized phage protein (TIGR01671 family)
VRKELLMKEYRGKTVKGKWVYGNLIINNGKPFIVGDVVDVDSDQIMFEWWAKVDKDTVGQYTGFRDDNNTKVYGGDFIRVLAGTIAIDTSYVGKRDMVKRPFIGVVQQIEGRWVVNFDSHFNDQEFSPQGNEEYDRTICFHWSQYIHRSLLEPSTKVFYLNDVLKEGGVVDSVILNAVN